MDTGANEDPEEDGNESPHAETIHSSDDVFIYITNVRLSSDGNWDVPYIKCDN
ncbi:MAG: hypothetical protein IPP81_22010 [Chitinophagaceae bacterium]|nr:hypothetical protein [Chitinophagaceae bacterium]